MNNPLSKTALFPNHRFDFRDPVYVASIGQGGRVEGIWYRDGTWCYRIAGLPCMACTWWPEAELALGCPNCFAPWDMTTTDCAQCSFATDDL